MKHHIIQNIFKYVNHSNIEEEINFIVHYGIYSPYGNFNILAAAIDTPKLFNFNLLPKTYTPCGQINFERFTGGGNYQCHAQPDEDEDENEFESDFGLF